MMENKSIAEAIRFKITEKLGKDTVESDEVNALIDEVDEVVVQLNKIFISELRRLEKLVLELSSSVSYVEYKMDEQEEKREGQVNNITINLNKDDIGRGTNLW